MKIALYGGTFDPIHHGHLILAREAVEQLGLDRLIFIPNALSPHKTGTQPASAELRVAMVRAAIAGEPRFEVDESELRRPAPSYTVDTVLEMRERFGAEARLFYLIGQDNLAALATWRRAEELRRMVTFVVLSREGVDAPPGGEVIRRTIDISATEIRKRVAKRLSIRYLVPEPVNRMITQHDLYQ